MNVWTRDGVKNGTNNMGSHSLTGAHLCLGVCKIQPVPTQDKAWLPEEAVVKPIFSFDSSSSFIFNILLLAPLSLNDPVTCSLSVERKCKLLRKHAYLNIYKISLPKT